jgi:hypothetical protein
METNVNTHLLQAQALGLGSGFPNPQAEPCTSLDKSTALKPPPLPQPTSTAAEECVDMNSQSEMDGLEFLYQPPPDLIGVEGTVFAVAADIDIQSPLLLDILADKPQAQLKLLSRKGMSFVILSLPPKKLQSYQKSRMERMVDILAYSHMSANLL